MKVGVAYEPWSVPTPRARFEAFRRLNADHLVYFVNAPNVWLEPDVFDWTGVDEDAETILSLGMELCPKVVWYPPHTSRGQRTGLEFASGCSAVTPDGGLRFACERDYCANPAPIEGMIHFGRAIAKRPWAKRVYAWAAGNEWDTDTFNPFVHNCPKHPLHSYDFGLWTFYRDYVSAVLTGIRIVLGKNVRTFGPESATSDGFRRSLDIAYGNLADGAGPNDPPIFSKISCHLYPWSTGIIDRLNEQYGFRFAKSIAQDPRPIEWISEIGDTDYVQAARDLRNALGEAVMLSFYCERDGRYLTQLFEPGTWETDAEARAATKKTKYVLNAKGREFAALNAPKRRRGVRTA